MQKSGFPKMRHYVGFSQIGSLIGCAEERFDYHIAQNFGWENLRLMRPTVHEMTERN